MMEIVVDSGVFIAFFIEGDKFRPPSLKLIEKVRNGEIEPYIPAIFLPEVCGSLARRVGKSLAKLAKNEIEKMVEVEILLEEELHEKRIRNSAKAAIRFGIKGSDSVFVSLAQEFGAPLATFDEELKKRIKGKVKLFEI